MSLEALNDSVHESLEQTFLTNLLNESNLLNQWIPLISTPQRTARLIRRLRVNSHKHIYSLSEIQKQ